MASLQALIPSVDTQANASLKACALPQAWRGAACWRVLDTAFREGERFSATWGCWAADDQRPTVLHYVAITPMAPALQRLLANLAAHAALPDHAAELERQYFGLLPGFHRLELHGGRVLLTLCIGRLDRMLREQQFLTDSVYLAQPSMLRNRWQAKAIARLCRPGSRLAVSADVHGDLAQLLPLLEQAGIVAAPSSSASFDKPTAAGSTATERIVVAAAPRAAVALQYLPRWPTPHSRHTWRRPAGAPSSCIVVGAGLAGAAVAAALARRGWQVHVVDQAPTPAAGASALPAGLLVPPVSRDDAPRSRLARAGMRLTLEACQRLLKPGQDWCATGALELPSDGAAGLPHEWPAQGREWSTAQSLAQYEAQYEAHHEVHHATLHAATWARGLAPNTATVWHAHAAWIKPAKLVQALLAQPNITFTGGCRAEKLWRVQGQWQVLDASGAPSASADHLVIATARDTVRLANGIDMSSALSSLQPVPLATMQRVGGQMSWGLQEDGDAQHTPPFAVNGAGHFTGNVPTEEGPAWFTGATYTPHAGAESVAAPDPQDGHRHNLERLQHLLPGAALHLASRFDTQQVRAWSGERCTTADRLPAVGPLQAGPAPHLWISTGMGSRGLTYALLCAELLAAQLCAEPSPVEASLAKSLSATRPRLLKQTPG